MKKVFLIILNWNGGEMTIKCLESVVRCLVIGDSEKEEKTTNTQPLTPITQVVVVDNGSTDGSTEMIKEMVTSDQWLVASERNEKKKKTPVTSHQSPVTLRLIKNSLNLGFAEGNNVGIRYALENGADYVCLLNNDTRVDPNFLNELVKVAESDEKIGIVGGKIYFEKGYEFHKERYKKSELGKVIWYAGGLIDWQNVYASHRGVDEVDYGQYDPPVGGTETEYVNGCLMLIKREVFEKIGLLDPKYYLYFEENDFCQKAKKEGFKLFYTPKSIIWHLNAQSSGPGSGLHDYFLTRNRLLFGMCWAPLQSRLSLIKESIGMMFRGRKWQKIGVRDFYLGRLGKGSWNE